MKPNAAKEDLAQAAPSSVGLIGYGAIGSQIGESLNADAVLGVELVGVFDLYISVPEKTTRNQKIKLNQVASIQDLCQLKPDLIIEAAGHLALIQCGAQVLQAGIDLLVVSVGALGDDSLLKQLRDISAKQGTGRLIISTGAIGGIDIFNAVKLAGKITSAEIISTKPVRNFMVPELDPKIQAQLEQAAQNEKNY